MRYYSIEIENFKRYTSHPQSEHGPADPGALQVEMDLFVLPYAVATIQSHVRIWGIPLSDISQAVNLARRRVKVFGGMGIGLPLANPQQAGLLVDGTIWQPYGNWIGTDMTLDLNFLPPPESGDSLVSAERPKNITFTWKKGQPLKQVIDDTLKQAFPNSSRQINIKDNLVAQQDESGYYGTISHFSNWVKNVSKALLGGDYQGVDIMQTSNTFRVYDASTMMNPKVIAFTDLIGQPTWLSLQVVSITTVMRADINPGDFIKLPPTAVVTTQQVAAGQSSQVASGDSVTRQSSIFQGSLQVKTVRHVGNSRQPDGRAWVTVIEAYFNPTSSGLGAPASGTDSAPLPVPGYGGLPTPWTTD